MSHPTGDFTLYGMQASLYTGKARAYMRRNRIPVTERGVGHPDYHALIMPQLGRLIMPVIETPDGTLVQDGTDILDYLEGQGFGREPLYPDDAVLKAISLLFELFGNEGLLRPAMHYRWNFDEDNLAFIQIAFDDVLPAHLDAEGRSAMFDHASGRMRKAGQAFGVIPDTYAAIEASYAEFLSLFEAHLEGTYYLLGNRPTIGDYGLFNPLYAHLARDPHPALLMKSTAPRVFYWVERMNRAEVAEEHTIDNPPTSLFARDAFPDTLMALMRYISEEYLAEITAHVDFTNNWLTEQGEEPDTVKAPLGRGIGFAEFDWRGQRISSAVLPYRFYLLQRLQDHMHSVSESDQLAIRSAFGKSGLESLLDIRTDRRVIRKNHLEFWAT
jgi:glutathione S-transferase